MLAGINILGVGCISVDDMLYVDAYPPADAKARVVERERFCGGLTATALVAAARLGARCAFAGQLGSDELSQYALGQLVREGVDVSLVRRTPEARPIHSTIIVDAGKSTRNIFFDLRGAHDLPADWPPADSLRTVQALVVDNFHLPSQLRLAQQARELGVAVIADFERADAPGLDRLIPLVDHLIVSQAFASQLTGAADPRQAAAALWDPRRVAVVVTAGDRGAWLATAALDPPSARAALDVVHQPAFAVRVVDTTGCGDVFHGAYAAAWVSGQSIRDAVRFAAAAAAIKATRRGGQPGAPRFEELLDFLEQHACPTNP